MHSYKETEWINTAVKVWRFGKGFSVLRTKILSGTLTAPDSKAGRKGLVVPSPHKTSQVPRSENTNPPLFIKSSDACMQCF